MTQPCHPILQPGTAALRILRRAIEPKPGGSGFSAKLSTIALYPSLQFAGLTRGGLRSTEAALAPVHHVPVPEIACFGPPLPPVAESCLRLPGDLPLSPVASKLAVGKAGAGKLALGKAAAVKAGLMPLPVEPFGAAFFGSGAADLGIRGGIAAAGGTAPLVAGFATGGWLAGAGGLAKAAAVAGGLAAGAAGLALAGAGDQAAEPGAGVRSSPVTFADAGLALQRGPAARATPIPAGFVSGPTLALLPTAGAAVGPTVLATPTFTPTPGPSVPTPAAAPGGPAVLALSGPVSDPAPATGPRVYATAGVGLMTRPETPTVNAQVDVPEPASLLTLLAGAGAAILARRRTRRPPR